MEHDGMAERIRSAIFSVIQTKRISAARQTPPPII
jgi:hypothetical protein